jgi:glycosyl transferase family 1
MKILLVKALADNHGYTQFAHSLSRAFAEIGCEAVISDQAVHAVDGAAPAIELARDLQRSRYDAVLSFSSFFGAATLDNGVSLFDALGVKFLGWQLDHPIYAPQSLARVLKARFSVFANRNHLAFVRAIKVPGAGAVMLAGGEAPQAPLTEFRSRDWPVFIAANFVGAPEALWEQAEDSAGKRLLVGVVDRLMADPRASLLSAFNGTSDALRLGVRLGDDRAFDDQMVAFLREPLTYVRRVDRIAIVRSLADSGLPLTLCGPGWRDFLGERRNVTYLDQGVDFERLGELYNRAKIVINLNAGNGACERALYAALAGAAVVSDLSDDLADQFGGEGEIGFFDRARPASVAETVGRLLESDAAERMAEAGRQRVLNSGLWRHRAEQAVRFLKGSA